MAATTGVQARRSRRHRDHGRAALPRSRRQPAPRHQEVPAAPSPTLTSAHRSWSSAGEVHRYAAVCGFPTKDVAPVPYLHMLAFPLHMELMTDAAFPFPAIGSVHLENSITQHRPVGIGEIGVAVTPGRQPARQHQGPGVGHERDRHGRRRGRVGVGLDVPPGRQGRQGERRPGRSFTAIEAKGPVWSIPENIGRTYGAVSGDRNPIHLYPLTAKALGFRRHIAHGMWSKARCIAALENRLPDHVRVEVGFKKPIFLPGTAAVRRRGEPGRLGLRSGQPEVGRPAPAGANDGALTREVSGCPGTSRPRATPTYQGTGLCSRRARCRCARLRWPCTPPSRRRW